MPRPKLPRFVRTPQQTLASYRARAENLRRIAALSRDEHVRQALLRRAGEWDRRAEEVVRAAANAAEPGA